MHFVLSWDISATGPARERIEQRLKQVIQPYSWVRPLTTFYIIQVHSQREWDTILNDLNRTIGSDPVQFVMTPLMSGGKYNGGLSQDLWDEINQRSR